LRISDIALTVMVTLINLCDEFEVEALGVWWYYFFIKSAY